MSTTGKLRHVARKRFGPGLVLLWILLAILLLAALWCRYVTMQIERYATEDQSAPSDAIAVFGAAEYAGRPSPVFKARLDHAQRLFDHGIAPLIITLGGDGGDQFSEGQVGREYLMGAGVPESALIAETQSTNTSQSVKRLVVIARVNHIKRIVIVSDDTHLFRIHEVCEANGLDVLTSPRPRVPTEDPPNRTDALVHEVLTYSAWRLNLD
jgi:uncharacterized SAM-binding protein YcdF (DUF218 family)